ncbi:2-octaprenyl-6-methoxyphenyl hydroxylase [Rheinheimera marina]|uniref:2-octaprenyl-6-methoxyphenyl hydroxylase n=1 Tax=Rheinheimera marina TaxID=1774958 RepID=A0ABV9JKK6_9GAMM
MTEPFDILISGGGMAGAMLAHQLLQHAGLKVALIEQQAQASPSKSSFDSRSIALSQGSIGLLKNWGLWSLLAPHASPIKTIAVSDKGHFGKTYLQSSDYQLDALGQVIEVEHIGTVLHQKLQPYEAQGRLVWFRPDAISAITPSLDLQQVQLKSGVSLSCRLLVIAEGGASPSRELAGFALQSDDYGQTALIANIGLQGPHQGKAFERFTSTGPLALLPLTQQRYSLVWTLAPERAAALMQLPEADFLAALQSEAGYRAGVFHKAGQRALYPLTLRRASEAARHRVVLLGNSLHNLHPIAGQGFNLALRDIYSLLLLVQARINQATPAQLGDYAFTRAYQQLREPDMQQLILYTDALVRLFSNSSRLIALGRNIGLSGLNYCSGLKSQLAHFAMGLTPLKHIEQRLQQLGMTVPKRQTEGV